ncbi:MAG: replicative DNA helicase [Dehalococcoidia bacterium]
MVLDKLPPHDIAAEESVVAACLVDPEAIYKVAPVLKSDDFFREKNGWVFDACLSLWTRNEAINQITVAHELARREKLEAIGGVAYLSRMVADLPTVVGVEYYAQIVARDATYRRLISAAGQIAQYAYEGGPDLDAVLNRSETLLMALRGGEALRDFVHIKSLLEKYLDDAGDEEDPTAGPSVVRTGFIDLDTLLGGLKRSDLVLLAARPSVGKSALAMAFARNAAAGQRAKVAVFNLEMSGDQLAQRLVAAEAAVDSTRLRLGEHTEAEERRIMHALGILSECDIYIDDSPMMTVGELRGKVRRLQQEKGLDLLIIDYLQLMQGSERGNDNRVQEISFISRSLKNLARELNVPIVALSQLSRAVESRKPPIPMMSDLRESGCLSGDTLVALASGEVVSIASLVGQQPEVVCVDGWRLTTRRASRVWRTGHRPTFTLKTRTGRRIRATANHRFLLADEWRRLDELRPGDRIAIPRVYPEATPEQRWDPTRVTLLGHLIGDGCYVARQPLHYTSASQANIAAVASAAREAFGIEGRLVPQAYGGTSHFSFAPSHVLLAEYATRLDIPALQELAASDIYWDTVESVEPSGTEDVYDMCVPEMHNFVANGIVVHNSLEQDADVVMFIYREDYYTQRDDWQAANPEQPGRSFPHGIAQVIVAKHRNGPVGTVDLRFQHKTAKFEDLYAREEGQ